MSILLDFWSLYFIRSFIYVKINDKFNQIYLWISADFNSTDHDINLVVSYLLDSFLNKN